MRIFDQFKRPRQLLLDEAKLEDWADALIERQDIPKTIRGFLRELEHAAEDVARAANALQDEHLHERIPERASHIVAEHAKVLQEQAEALLNDCGFTTDPFMMQERIDSAVERIADYREKTIKSNAALEEHFSDQTRTLSDTIQRLEDLIINAGSELEQRNYDRIIQVKELAERHKNERQKRHKYRRTLNKYLAEKEEHNLKRQKHLTRIERQEGLVRDPKTIDALKNIKKLERDHGRLRQEFDRLFFDTRHHLLKQNLTLSEDMRGLFSRMKRDPIMMLKQEHELLRNELEKLAKQLQELDAEDKKAVIKRLTEMAKHIPSYRQKVIDDEPILRGMKRSVMHDIAALNIYEQEQFLNRTLANAADTQEKIMFITEELEGLEEEGIMDELRRLVKPFEAVIKPKRGDDENI